MYDTLMETVVDPYQRVVREGAIPSMQRQQVQRRELELIRSQQAQRANEPRQPRLSARIAAWWTLATARLARQPES